jgi:hypothetical protein
MDVLATRTVSPVTAVAHRAVHVTRLLSRLVVGISLGLVVAAPAIAEVTVPNPIATSPTTAQPTPGSLTLASAPSTTAPQTLPDGVYLYGESDQPDQPGRAYFVFEVTQSKVLGALYMPNSSFDCTQGRFHADRLALNVISSYEKTVHPYEIGLTRSSQVASTGNSAIPLGLEGFKPIAQVSENDRRILSLCKAAIAK